MSVDSSTKTIPPHPVPIVANVSLEYEPINNCHSSEFPISNLNAQGLEPASLPILAMHSHDAVELGYCHSGSGVLCVDNRVVSFVAGDICVVPDQMMHMSRTAVGEPPSQWTFFWVDHGLLLAAVPDAMDLLRDAPFSRSHFPYIFSHAQYPELCGHVLGIIEEIRGGEYAHRSVAKSLACAFMARLHRACRHLQQQQKAVNASEGIERISPALHHMIANYAQPIDADELAALASLSRRHFHRIFLSAVGETPVQYLAQLRVRMASAILSGSDKPISQIAFEVGFESINTFNRQFRMTLGASPSQWRSQCRRP